MPQREISYTGQFKRDLRLAQKRGCDIPKLQGIMMQMMNDQFPLPAALLDHPLTGNYKKHRELHVEPDWLLIYKISNTELQFVRTGSHSDLFKI